MPKNKKPKYRRQKMSGRSDLAFVELNGRRHCLGTYGTPESRGEFRRLTAEWETSRRQAKVSHHEITIVELVSRFWQHVEEYYRKPDGSPTTEVENYKQALRKLRQIYGTSLAVDFGPLALKSVRQSMIESAWSRPYINSQTGRIKRVFKWAVANELVPVNIYNALMTVEGLKKGRTPAREPKPVQPVFEEHILAVRPYVTRQVWTMVQLQLHGAARGGEIVIMRPEDLDTSGDVWLYSPESHKTAHHGHARTIYLGPKAQQALTQFLTEDGYLFDVRVALNKRRGTLMFSPKDAASERGANSPTHRRPDQIETRRRSTRRVGDRYTTASYRRAIERACTAANIPIWTPHRLRHTAATEIRRRFGLEAAQLLLRHRRADVTQIYAEVNQAKALELAKQIG